MLRIFKKGFLAFFFAALMLSACNGVGKTPEQTSTPPVPTATPLPSATPTPQPRVLTICLGQEPQTLYMYNSSARSMWAVLEADPHCWRYVADEGTESLPGRLAGSQFAVAPDAGLDVWIEQALATADECRTCEFFQNCSGYFKWPRRDYACAGVKRLFGELREAAAELRRDLASAPTN